MVELGKSDMGRGSKKYNKRRERVKRSKKDI